MNPHTTASPRAGVGLLGRTLSINAGQSARVSDFPNSPVTEIRR